MGLEVRFDMLVVDDGSPDGTADAVKEVMKRYKGRVFLMERKGKPLIYLDPTATSAPLTQTSNNLTRSLRL